MKRLLLCQLFFIWMLPLEAAMVITGTRVVYPEKSREISVEMNNPTSLPVLVQAWVDHFEDGPNKNELVPFIITPPIFRVEPNQGQTVRVVYTKDALPQDRESLFRFNVLDVPPKPDADVENYIQIAIANRLKFFFRPAALKGSFYKNMQTLSWSATQEQQDLRLKLHNPTPYHYTISKIEFLLDEEVIETVKDKGQSMVLPFSDYQFTPDKALSTAKYGRSFSIKVYYIGDFGDLNSIIYNISL